MNNSKVFISELNNFFSITNESSTLYIYTYSFDEFVMHDLIQNHCPKFKNIYVFCDITKHTNRGVLSRRYKGRINVFHVWVDDPDSKSCAVFHPKLWAISNNNIVERIAISSINIKRYHLENNSNTLESFKHYETNIPQSKLPLYSHTKSKGSRRILLLSGESWFYDNANIKFSISKKSVLNLIKSNVEKSSRIIGVSPFISGPSLLNLFDKNENQSFWDQPNNRLKNNIHLKLLATENSLYWGSFNLTRQGLIGQDNKAINVEIYTYEELNNSKGFLEYLNSTLGKPKTLRDFKVDILPPGDSNDDEGKRDWREAKDLITNSPDYVCLSFKNGELQIEAVPNWKTSTKIVLHGNETLNADNKQATFFVSQNSNAIKIKRSQISTLAKMIEKNNFCPLNISGFKKDTLKWSTELDTSIITQFKLSAPANKTNKKNVTKKQRKKTINTKSIFKDSRHFRGLIFNDFLSKESIDAYKKLFSKNFDISWLVKLKEIVDENKK